MNNAYFEKNTKLQNRNRAGMIRSYRTARTFAEVLAMILDMLLSVIDRGLDILARSAASRLLRGTLAIVCLISFICLIGAVEHQVISLFSTVLIAAVLVIVEVLCLRKN